VRLYASVFAALAGLLGGSEPLSRAALPPPPAGAELVALARAPVRTPIASERIYFVMTDRYANGDPSNDRLEGFDPADSGHFHGGDFKGLTGDCTGRKQVAAPAKPARPLTGIASDAGGLARLKDLGFTAIWVTPPYKQKAVQGDSAAYHGYWGLDFTTVDPHLGTEQDFADFVSCAHRLGMKVFLDVVVNHTADVIIPSGGTAYEAAGYRDCRGRAFDPARFAGGRRFPCVNAANMPRVPVVFAPDRNAKSPAWLNDVTRYHNRGDINFSSCSEECFEQGDFFGLDDLFTEQPAVVDGLARIYGEWISKYKIDGFRIDTAKHVDAAFFRVWVPKIRAAVRAAGVESFELFGEVFDPSAINLIPFVRERGLPNVLDFPLQDAAASFAGGDSGARAISARLSDDDYFHGASGVAHTPPTFLGNHDMGRAATKIKERSGATGDELLRRVLLGHSLLYLLRGAPVVYYGDEVGMMGGGGDKAARQDMFPTQVREWRTEERVGGPPIGTGSSFDVVGHPVAEHLKALGRLRDEHPALSTGASIVRLARQNVLVVSRIDASARREYVAAFNSATAPARVTVATATPGSSWTTLLGAPVGVGGSLTLIVPGLSAVLLRADADLPVAAPASPRLTVSGDDLTDTWRVTAQAQAVVSVTFALKRGKKPWQRLAADDSPPYRAFLDPRRFRRNEAVHLVAVVRSLDGRTAVSKVVPFTVRRR